MPTPSQLEWQDADDAAASGRLRGLTTLVSDIMEQYEFGTSPANAILTAQLPSVPSGLSLHSPGARSQASPGAPAVNRRSGLGECGERFFVDRVVFPNWEIASSSRGKEKSLSTALNMGVQITRVGSERNPGEVRKGD